MKTITKTHTLYVCDTCQKEYTNCINAEECEKQHALLRAMIVLQDPNESWWDDYFPEHIIIKSTLTGEVQRYKMEENDDE